MTTRKGVGALSVVLLVAALLVGTGIGVVLSGQQTQEANVVDTFDGRIATFQPVQELTGYNDLDVTEQAINSTGTVDDGNVVTSFNINESNGDTIRLAYGLEFDGAMQDVDFELTNEGVDSNLDIMKAALLRDEDSELGLGDTTPIVKEFQADSDDEIDSTVSTIRDGDYVVLLEVRGTDTSGITEGQDLYTWDIEGQGDAGSDESESVSVTLDNLVP